MADASSRFESKDVMKVSLCKICLILTLAAILIIACLGYGYWAGNEMVARQGPQARAVIQLQLDASLAHLWFEEIISEDSEVNLDTVLAHLDQAQTSTHALLTGGEARVGQIAAVKEGPVREGIERIQSKLTRFREISLERWKNRAGSGIGSPTDQTYDQLFQSLLDTGHSVEQDLSASSKRQLAILKALQLSLMGVCLVTILSVGGLIGRMLSRQVRDAEAALAANQQLEASDQQMRAVNQRLTASEEKSRAERDKAHRYFTVAGTMLVVLSPDGCVERINQKGCEVIGAAEHEIVGKDWFCHFLPEPMQLPIRKVFDQLVAGEIEPLEFYENPVQTAKGKKRLIAWHNTLLKDDKGTIVGILSSGEDITERKRATEALKKKRELIVQLVETSPVGIVMTDATGQVRFANSPAEQILGLAADEMTGRPYNDPKWHITDYEGNPFPDEQLPFSQVRDRLQPVYGIRHAIEWPDGRRTLLSINATPLLDPNEQFTGMVGSVEDVTECVQAEKKVLLYQSHLRALVSELTLSEERERKRLAVELHDGICQSLAMAKLSVDQRLVNHSLSAIHDLLQEMQQTLVCIIDDTRSLTNNLGTPMLQQMGLDVALEKWLDTEITDKHGIKTEVIDKGTPRTLNEDTKALLFRAVRELATNVIKHAQAQTLTVILDTRAHELYLSVVDDGKGFNCPVPAEQDFREGGYGLFSIYERITYLGGDVTIDSSPGKGTQILLRLPLNNRSEQHHSQTPKR